MKTALNRDISAKGLLMHGSTVKDFFEDYYKSKIESQEMERS